MGIGRIDHDPPVEHDEDRQRRVAIRYAAERTRNLYFETSATSEPAFIAALAGWASSQRILYGSDWPWIPPRLMLAIVECSDLTPEAVADILGRNAGRLLEVVATN